MFGYGACLGNWYGDLMDTRVFPDEGQDLYVYVCVCG